VKEILVCRIERVVDFEIFCPRSDCAGDVDVALEVPGIAAARVRVYSIAEEGGKSTLEGAAWPVSAEKTRPVPA
jgi:hypothetical protein